MSLFYCHCSEAQVLATDKRNQVLEQWCESGGPMVAVPDLCGLTAQKHPILHSLAQTNGLTIAACHSRAIEGLFNAASTPLMDDQVIFMDLRDPTAQLAFPHPGNRQTEMVKEEDWDDRSFCLLYEDQDVPSLHPELRRQIIMKLLDRQLIVCASPSRSFFTAVLRKNGLILGTWPETLAPQSGRRGRAFNISAMRGEDIWSVFDQSSPTPAPTGSWQPWFPVIDPDRCTNCMQCLGFCLFGVYGLKENRKIEVKNPRNCKPRCPACSRVCPEMAILFPKHPSGSINGQPLPSPDTRALPKTDISALLGGNIYQTLRLRGEGSRPRFSRQRDPDQALAERLKRLAEMSGDIPAEVLRSLPSPEEIQRRILEARQKAEDAQKNPG